MESGTLETRLGPLAWQSSGSGPALVFFPGALANHDLWRDVIAALEDRYRCITIDLPLGRSGRWPSERPSATWLARRLLDCLELLDVDDATVVVNDTAWRTAAVAATAIGARADQPSRPDELRELRHFPPDSLKKASAASRASPGSPGQRSG